ncbi:unnamed protein product, partial [Pylaiella littoralis]
MPHAAVARRLAEDPHHPAPGRARSIAADRMEDRTIAAAATLGLPADKQKGRTTQSEARQLRTKHFGLFDRKFAAAWNLTDDQAGIDRIRRFGVPSGTLYKEYLRYFKALVTTVLQSHSLYTPQSSQVQLAVRDSILKQFPGMASD